jgi:hypothetical protein
MKVKYKIVYKIDINTINTEFMELEVAKNVKEDFIRGTFKGILEDKLKKEITILEFIKID